MKYQDQKKLYESIANKNRKYNEVVLLLKEARDMLVLCTLIDKSGQSKDVVDKIDTKMGWR